ncbi:MAG: hypothetical protein RLZZ282_340 [Verrucomicrobiota bacterium]
MICGEIDNTVEGTTTGLIWLAGRDAPLVLTLQGDCWRDLAGTRLRFRNPSPQVPSDAEALGSNQTGIVGDMTASRKCKVPIVSNVESQSLYQHPSKIPHEWKNTLYLEWFCEINGRVVIEASNYTLQISIHEWSMDDDAEEAQKLANLNAMRDFMAQLIHRNEATGLKSPIEGALDEFDWEQRLKESDRLTDAYQEVIEKYMEDADSECKEAFVMGWDGLLDAMATRDESGDENYSEDFLPYGQSVDVSYETGNEDDDRCLETDDLLFDEKQDHPLQIEAQELAMRAMDVAPQHTIPGSPAYQLVTCLLNVSTKLAGVLNDDVSERGLVLAILKRCLNRLNDAVQACQTLMMAEDDPDHLAALAHLRSSIFTSRNRIIELRRSLK